MRTPLATRFALAAVALIPAAALSAQETRFSPTLRVGQHLAINTIDGDVTVTRGDGRTAEIVANKRVRRGDASRVKAVMEETSDGFKVCTIYLRRDEADRDTCNRSNRDRRDSWNDHDNTDIEISYTVRLPSGVALAVNTVDGAVDVRGVDTPASVNSVDGDIVYEGVAPTSLRTVDGDIRASISGVWTADASLRTVDGSIVVELPADAALEVRGSTVDGSFHSDFPMTIRDKWGPRSFEGTIGGGGTRLLRLGSVDGDITLRRR